jgi:hypothetical protein
LLTRRLLGETTVSASILPPHAARLDKALFGVGEVGAPLAFARLDGQAGFLRSCEAAFV